MKKQDKEEVKVSKPKKTLEYRKVVDKVFQVAAYVAVIALAAYGLRGLLRTIDDKFAIVATVLIVTFIVHAMFPKNK